MSVIWPNPHGSSLPEGPHEPEYPVSACLLFGCLAVIASLALWAIIILVIGAFHR